MQQPKNHKKRHLRAVPASTSTSASSQAQEIINERGVLVGVVVDGKFHSVEQTLPAPVADDPIKGFVKQAIQAQIDLYDAANVARDLARAQAEHVHADDVIPWIGRTIDIWRYDVEVYRPSNRASWVAGNELLQGLRQLGDTMLATAAGALAEANRRELTDGFEETDYKRKRSRYEAEATFAADLGLKPAQVANDHELNKLRLDADLQLSLARLDADARGAERTEASVQADKDRDLEMLRTMLGANQDLTNAMAELRLIEQQQPSEQITAAMKTLNHAFEALADLGRVATEKERQQLAPIVLEMVKAALAQAARVSRRG